MSSFTPQEIEEFLQEFFDTVGARQYVGARYVPVFGHGGGSPIEWDGGADAYEPLSIVYHVGATYTSRRYVPAGVDISDTDYWVITANYNAQMEQYRQEVLGFQGQIDDLRDMVGSDYVPFPVPPQSKYGNVGQVLSTLDNGATEWVDPVTIDADVAEPIIEDWLDAHPEATTTVLDGSITTAKLADGAVTNNKLEDFSLCKSFYNTMEFETFTPSWSVGVIARAGNITNNSSFRYTIIPIEGNRFVKITGTLHAIPASDYIHIAFYNALTPLATTFISGYAVADSSTKNLVDYVVAVPADARAMVICTSTASSDDMELSVSKNWNKYDFKTISYLTGYALSHIGYVFSLNNWYASLPVYVSGNTHVVFDKNIPATTPQAHSSVAFYNNYGEIISRINTECGIAEIPTSATYMRVMTQDNTTKYALVSLAASDATNPPVYEVSDNLFEMFGDFTVSKDGLTFVKHGNEVTINGTNTGGISIGVLPIPVSLEPGKYVITHDANAPLYLQYYQGESVTTLYNRKTEIEILDNQSYAFIRLLANPSTFTNSKVHISIEKVVVDPQNIVVDITTAAQLYDFLKNFVADNDNHYVVNLAPDTYDLYTGLYETDVALGHYSSSTANYLNNVEINGNGATVIIDVPAAVSAANRDAWNTVSCFNVTGNIYMHDLNVIARNCRYAVHDESVGNVFSRNTIHRYENVHMVFDRTDASVTTAMSVIGIGGSMGQKYAFKNCVFERVGVGPDTSYAYGASLYIHGRAYNIESIEFENCIFLSATGHNIYLAQYTGNDKPTFVKINNCYLDKNLRVKPQTDSGFTKQQWVIDVINSHYNDFVVDDTYPLLEDPTIVDTINGTLSHSYTQEQ